MSFSFLLETFSLIAMPLTFMCVSVIFALLIQLVLYFTETEIPPSLVMALSGINALGITMIIFDLV